MNFKHDLPRALSAAILAVGMTTAALAHAAVVVEGTRVVYRAQERETTIKLTNKGKVPALAQVWIDNGDPKAPPSSIKVPFTLTPAVARIDAGKAQTLRIFYTGEALPQDRESVFWLNVLEVPPKPDPNEAGSNTLQLAFRTRIKLFFRPSGLKGLAVEAPGQLEWTLDQSRKEAALVAHNPTPYYVSVINVQLSGHGKSARSDASAMVEPGGTASYPLKGEVPRATDASVHYHTLGDLGNSLDGDSPLSQAR